MQATVQPHEQLFALAAGGFITRALHVVAELGIADLIDDQPATAAALAKASGSDTSSLDRVLHLLASTGIFAPTEGGWTHTEGSQLLRSDHPMSMRSFARMMGLPVVWGSVTTLAESVRTGIAGPDAAGPGGAWAYFQHHPDEARIFGQAMTDKAAADVMAVLGAFSFERFTTIADIGGGHGHLLRAVLDRTPGATGVLFDLPDVVERVGDLHPRATTVGGDFFTDSLPAADAYVLMDIIHDWADPQASAILAAVRAAAASGATLLIIEASIAEDRPDPRGRTLDIVMLTVTGGRERTPSAHAALLAPAGFRLDEVIDTMGPSRILRATAV